MNPSQRLENEEPKIDLERVAQDTIHARIGTSKVELKLTPLADGTFLLSGGGRRYHIYVQKVDDTVFVAVGPHSFAFSAQQAAALKRRAAHMMNPEVAAPMPGRVVKILVEQGAVVGSGQPLVVLEAMKMETVLSAEFPAKVVSVKAAVGTQVDAGSVLLELSPLTQPPAAETAAP